MSEDNTKHCPDCGGLAACWCEQRTASVAPANRTREEPFVVTSTCGLCGAIYTADSGHECPLPTTPTGGGAEAETTAAGGGEGEKEPYLSQCFHVEHGLFCKQMELWHGHPKHHGYVSLSYYIKSRLAAAEQKYKELDLQWRNWGIIEVAIRNPSVSDYMNHWEGRAEKAEARVRELSEEKDTAVRQARQQQRAEIADALQKMRLVPSLEPGKLYVQEWLRREGGNVSPKEETP